MKIEKISEFWPDWQVEELISQDSYGKVYKAIKNEHSLISEAAIKVISIPQSTAESEALRFEGMSELYSKSCFHGIVEEFLNEIKIMYSMKGTTNIVSVEDFKVIERTEGTGWDIFIRMEYLTPFIKYAEGRILEEDQIIKLGIDVCNALEVCARQNTVHRDIKPENIFVSKNGDFKVGDFGIARKLDKTGTVMSGKGTHNYTAPEVAHQLSYDATADIYSLGIVLYNLLNNNKAPFLDPTSQNISYRERNEAYDRRMSGEPLPPPCNASKELASIILCACSYDPKKRFKTPAALRNALITYRERKGAVPVPIEAPQGCISSPGPIVVQEPKRSEKKKSRLPLIIAVSALIIALAAGCASLFLLDPFYWFSREENITQNKDETETEKTKKEDNEDTEDTEDPSAADSDIPAGPQEPLSIEAMQGYWIAEMSTDKLMESLFADVETEIPDSTYRYDPSTAPDIHYILYVNDDVVKSYIITDELIEFSKHISIAYIEYASASRSLAASMPQSYFEDMIDEINAMTPAEFIEDNETFMVDGIFVFDTEENIEYTIHGNTFTLDDGSDCYVMEYKNGILDVISYEGEDGSETYDIMDNNYALSATQLEFRLLTDEELEEMYSEYTTYTEEELCISEETETEDEDEEIISDIQNTIVFGEVNGNVYENDFFGIGIELNDDWEYYSRDELAEINDMIENQMGNIGITYDTEDVMYDMFATNSDGLSTINMGILMQPSYYANNLEEYLMQIIPVIEYTFEQAGIENLETDISSVQLDGKAFTSCSIYGEYQDIGIYQRVLLISKDEYIATFTVSSFNEDISDEILSKFYTK